MGWRRTLRDASKLRGCHNLVKKDLKNAPNIRQVLCDVAMSKGKEASRDDDRRKGERIYRGESMRCGRVSHDERRLGVHAIARGIEFRNETEIAAHHADDEASIGVYAKSFITNR
jgi:hypothetical protein